MTKNALWFRINGECLLPALQEVHEKLDSAAGEAVLDFSAVQRIDPGAVRSLEQLAGEADQKAVKIVIHGVNVEVYKVLKLVKLTTRFTFEG